VPTLTRERALLRNTRVACHSLSSEGSVATRLSGTTTWTLIQLQQGAGGDSRPAPCNSELCC